MRDRRLARRDRSGLAPEKVAFWQDVLRAATRQPGWQAELARLSWSPAYWDGETLRAFLTQERADTVAVLKQLGLLKARAAI